MTDEVMPFFVSSPPPYSASSLRGGIAYGACLALLFLASCTSPVTHPPSPNGARGAIRVCIDEGTAPADIQILSSSILSIGGTRDELAAPLRCRVSPSGKEWKIETGGTPRVIPAAGCRLIGRGSSPAFSYKGKVYSDTLLIFPQGEKLFLLNTLPLEDYLLQVVPNEIGAERRPADAEAVKAQAIVARSYAYAKMASPTRRLFDVYDDERDQLFTGFAPPSTLVSSAVRATEGAVVFYAGSPAETYYHSACGGRTEAPQLVWNRPMAKAYLNGIPDDDGGTAYCSVAPSFRWMESYTRPALESIIRAHLPLALPAGASAAIPSDQYLLDLRILTRLPSGRVGELQIVFGNSNAQTRFSIFADKIRWVLRRTDTGGYLRSALFNMEIDRDADNWITAVRIRGGGSGHGIGFCQWGAIGMSRAGKSCSEILLHYFPGTEIRQVY